LSIVAWAGYVERGATDKSYDWVTGFEKDTGCTVSVKTAATSDEMVALMNEGGFDLVTASGDASLRLVSGGRVQEINVALVPSYGTVDKRLQDATGGVGPVGVSLGQRGYLAHAESLSSVLSRHAALGHHCPLPPTIHPVPKASSGVSIATPRGSGTGSFVRSGSSLTPHYARAWPFP
jgi:hypothetical protein